jgi:Ca2+-binding EF-hand superfamily protein
MSLEEAISAAELHVMKKAFSLFDGNADGRIDLSEFGNVIRAIGFNATNEQIQTTFKQFDRNDDGGIDFDEFVVMSRTFAGCSRQKLEENLRQAFR